MNHKTFLIGKREFDSIINTPDSSKIDFNSADLENRKIPRQDLSGADFRKSILRGVDFSGKDLSKAKFMFADLTGANLRGTNLTDTIFSQAILKQVNLQGATIHGTKFGEADMEEADFNGNDLRNVTLINIEKGIFENCNFEGCRFFNTKAQEAKFDGANFKNSVLRGADFSQSELTNVDFSHAQIVATNFSGAKIHKANMVGAIVEGVELEGADLYQIKIGGENWEYDDLIFWKGKGATIDESSLLPEIAQRIAGLTWHKGRLQLSFYIKDASLELVGTLRRHLQEIGRILNTHSILNECKVFTSSETEHLVLNIEFKEMQFIPLIYEVIKHKLKEFSEVYAQFAYNCFENVVEVIAWKGDEYIRLTKHEFLENSQKQNEFNDFILTGVIQGIPQVAKKIIESDTLFQETQNKLIELYPQVSHVNPEKYRYTPDDDPTENN